MDRRTGLTYLALGLAAASLALSAWLAASARASHGPAPACSWDDAALKREVAELRKAVGVDRALGGARADADLARRVGALEAAIARAEPSSSAAPTRGAVAAPAAAERFPRYDHFEVPNAMPVKVSQDADGAISATNSDPALAGKTIIVTAVNANGERSPMTILVPPPER